MMLNGMARRVRKPTEFFMESDHFDRDAFQVMMLDDVPACELHAALHESTSQDEHTSEGSSSDVMSAADEDHDKTDDSGSDGAEPSDSNSNQSGPSERSADGEISSGGGSHTASQSDGAGSPITEALRKVQQLMMRSQALQDSELSSGRGIEACGQ